MSSGRGWNRCCLCPRGRVGRRRGRNGSSSTGSDGGCRSVRPGGTSQTATALGGRCMRGRDRRAARRLAPVPDRPGRHQRPAHRRRPSPHTARQGPGRQGLQLPRQPRLPAPTRHRLHHSRTSRPTTTPQEPRPPRRRSGERVHPDGTVRRGDPKVGPQYPGFWVGAHRKFRHM